MRLANVFLRNNFMNSICKQTRLMSERANMKHHHERRLLRYSAKQLYDVVADVDHYSEFVPWCQYSRVTLKKDLEFEADLSVGFGVFLEKYKSKVTLNPPNSVLVESLETNLLHNLNTEWKFTQASDPSACWVTFRIDFSFKSALYNHVCDMFLNEVVDNMVNAFESRCKSVYGRK